MQGLYAQAWVNIQGVAGTLAKAGLLINAQTQKRRGLSPVHFHHHTLLPISRI